MISSDLRRMLDKLDRLAADGRLTRGERTTARGVRHRFEVGDYLAADLRSLAGIAENVCMRQMAADLARPDPFEPM